MFYLTMHSTHFGYMVLDLGTIYSREQKFKTTLTKITFCVRFANPLIF